MRRFARLLSSRFLAWSPRCVLAVAVLLLVSLPVRAAEITVGPPGSGADFDDIQPAVDAAAPGDTILVLAGTYSRFRVDKSLRVIGESSGLVTVSLPSAQDVCLLGTEFLLVEVADLAATDEVVLQGLTLTATFAPCPPWLSCHAGCPSVLLRDNEGVVQLSDVVLSGAMQGIEVQRCDLVLLDDCSNVGTANPVPRGNLERDLHVLGLEDSAAWVSNCRFVGASGGNCDGTDSLTWPAIDLDDSVLYLAASSLVGGAGGAFFDFSSGCCGLDGASPAIAARGASLLKLVGGGGSSNQIRGGGGLGGSSGGIPCIGEGAPGILAEDTALVLLQEDVPVVGGTDGAGVQQPPIDLLDGAALVTLAPTYPTLAVQPATPSVGALLTLDLYGSPGSAFLLYASPSAVSPGTIVGVDGATVLDPGSSTLVTSTLLDAAGVASVTVQLPPNPALAGLSFPLQGIEFGPEQVAASNPVRVSISL